MQQIRLDIDLGLAPVLTREMGEQLRGLLNLDERDSDGETYLIATRGNYRGASEAFAKALIESSVRRLDGQVLGVKYTFAPESGSNASWPPGFGSFLHKLLGVQHNYLKQKAAPAPPAPAA